jgi:hypothetical protein
MMFLDTAPELTQGLYRPQVASSAPQSQGGQVNPSAIVQGLFMQYLGRQPSAAELQGFASAIQNGVTDATGISLFLQGSSEFRQGQVGPSVQNFQNLLSQGNDNILNQGFDKARQQFALNGRVNSTGLDSAFASASANLAAQQSPQVANYYGQLQQNAMQPNPYGGQFIGNQANYTSQQNAQNFQANQAALDRQAYKSYYDQAMAQAKRNQLGGFAGGIGQLAGTAIGSAWGLPGAQIGGSLGKSAGTAIGSGIGLWG